MINFIKNNLKTIVAIIITFIVTLSMSVYATIKFQASEIEYNDTPLDQVLDDLYNASRMDFCHLVSEQFGTKNNVGAKYKCNLGDNVDRYFYILTVNSNNTVDLIMDTNLVSNLSYSDAMNYLSSGVGSTYKTSWKNVYNIKLPDAVAIARAVGNNSWTVSGSWFYFDKYNGSYGQTKVASASNLSNYRWLFNYTKGCTNYGCDSGTDISTMSNAYVTSSVSGSDYRVVDYRGIISSGPTSDTVSRLNVRPVITVLKSNLN